MRGDVELKNQPIVFQIFALFLAAGWFAFLVYVTKGSVLLLLLSKNGLIHILKSILNKKG